VGGHVSRLGEVETRDLEDFIRLKGQSTEALAGFSDFNLVHDEPAFALLAGTGCATDAVDVLFSRGGHSDLNDVGHIREIHTTSSDV
jgi:hypothetical protein